MTRPDAGYALKGKGTRIESSPCNYVLPSGFNCTEEGTEQVKRGRLWEMFCAEHRRERLQAVASP